MTDHLPRALEMANDRAERWRQRYNGAVADLEAATEQLAEAWDEGAEATAEWMANNPGPSGIPHDPPANPYRKG